MRPRAPDPPLPTTRRAIWAIFNHHRRPPIWCHSSTRGTSVTARGICGPIKASPVTRPCRNRVLTEGHQYEFVGGFRVAGGPLAGTDGISCGRTRLMSAHFPRNWSGLYLTCAWGLVQGRHDVAPLYCGRLDLHTAYRGDATERRHITLAPGQAYQKVCLMFCIVTVPRGSVFRACTWC